VTRVLSRNLHIPIARHPRTGAAVTVLHALQGAPSVVPPEALSKDEQIEFVIDAWRRGLWDGDILTDRPEPITLEIAEAEVRAGSEEGERLLESGLMALGILRDQIAAAGSGETGEG